MGHSGGLDDTEEWRLVEEWAVGRQASRGGLEEHTRHLPTEGFANSLVLNGGARASFGVKVLDHCPEDGGFACNVIEPATEVDGI